MTATSAIGSTTRRAGTRGFSLVELLVVVAILAMIAAVFPFALDRLIPHRRMTAAAEALFTHAREVQSQAVSIGRSARITANSDHYVLDYRSARPSERVTLPADLTLTLKVEPQQQDVSQVIFYGDGSSTGGRFTLSDGTRRAAVDVSRLTGRVTRVR